MKQPSVATLGIGTRRARVMFCIAVQVVQVVHRESAGANNASIFWHVTYLRYRRGIVNVVQGAPKVFKDRSPRSSYPVALPFRSSEDG